VLEQIYDAILIVSFGGPEGPQDVVPFLENVLRGKDVPRERLLKVADHYQRFGGVSPINQQNRQLVAALEDELSRHGPSLPVYWGNRNWHPLLPDTLRRMKEDGVKRALAFVTSAYSSYSGCRQYLEDIERSRDAVGQGAPHVDKLRAFFNHPGFIEAVVDQVQAALARIPRERHDTAYVIYTAHSIPLAMARQCQYTAQLMDACQLVSQVVGKYRWKLTYQSRSGPPGQPWLEPDVCDYLREGVPSGHVTDVVLVPIGFISDHVEVLYDLDTEAGLCSQQLGLNMVRAETVGAHPKFIAMIRELILERTCGAPRRALGALGAGPDTCPDDCCPSGRFATSCGACAAKTDQRDAAT
jgi:ferrochelatase